MTSTSVSTVSLILSAGIGSGLTSHVCLPSAPPAAPALASSAEPASFGAQPIMPSAATLAALRAAPLSRLRREMPLFSSLMFPPWIVPSLARAASPARQQGQLSARRAPHTIPYFGLF